MSVALPSAGEFSSIAAVGGRLIVSGGSLGTPTVSGYWNLLVKHGLAKGTCDAAIVDPATLALGRLRRANCGDPALYGERVLPIAYYTGGTVSAGAGTSMIAVRIARVDPAARDGYRLGPVVTSYPQCSDCQSAWIYGADSLWLYNPLGANPTRRSGVLLRISARTGAVLQRWAMPEILRALLAVDADGLWLSPSIESGEPGGLPPAKLIPYLSLYRVTPGARSPQRVFTVGGAGARWLIASGHTAAAAIDNSRGASVVWTFAHGVPPLRGELISVTSGTELGMGDSTVVGGGRAGAYSVLLGAGVEKVMHVGPFGRDEHLVATIPARNVGVDDSPPAGVVLDGSFYFLDPSGVSGATRLHRITPR